MEKQEEIKQNIEKTQEAQEAQEAQETQENIQTNKEKINKLLEQGYIDISQDFLEMESSDFRRFIRQNKDKNLLIVIDWIDVSTARKLKAFVEKTKKGQSRKVIIRATKEEYNMERNVFCSGVEWEEKKN